MIGVFMSATLPARLGEPSRALIVARRAGRMRELLPVVLGTLVSQTLLNMLALLVLGARDVRHRGRVPRRRGRAGVRHHRAARGRSWPLLAVPALLRKGKPSRFVRVQQALGVARRRHVQVRKGLEVFRNPRLGGWAIVQLPAWGVQWISCYVLLVALGLDGHAGIGAAAAVLFAVNVTAALPATPSNLGVFQAACVAVLSAYGVGHPTRWPTGSSCRRWRSPPPWRWACPPSCARA